MKCLLRVAFGHMLRIFMSYYFEIESKIVLKHALLPLFRDVFQGGRGIETYFANLRRHGHGTRTVRHSGEGPSIESTAVE